MKKKYSNNHQIFVALLFIAMLISACRKDNHTPTPTPAPASLATLGLYELDSTINNTIYKRIFIVATKVGTKTVNYPLVFDTGSAGMTMDANGILPASMITSSGIQVAGDSVTVNGITVTTQQAVIAFGNTQAETQEFGNLAYTTVTIGDQNGKITTTRIPIFLYYKVVDLTNNNTI